MKIHQRISFVQKMKIQNVRIVSDVLFIQFTKS